MVERPIKKSERQANTSPSNAVEEAFATESNSVEGSLDPNSQTLQKQSTAQPVRRKDKTDKTTEKGKGNQQRTRH